MTPNEYQALAARTLIEKPGFFLTDNEVMLLWNVTGLAGETGEFVDQVKKSLFHRQPLDHDKLKRELGDILWYAAAIATRSNADDARTVT